MKSLICLTLVLMSAPAFADKELKSYAGKASCNYIEYNKENPEGEIKRTSPCKVEYSEKDGKKTISVVETREITYPSDSLTDFVFSLKDGIDFETYLGCSNKIISSTAPSVPLNGTYLLNCSGYGSRDKKIDGHVEVTFVDAKHIRYYQEDRGCAVEFGLHIGCVIYKNSFDPGFGFEVTLE